MNKIYLFQDLDLGYYKGNCNAFIVIAKDKQEAIKLCDIDCPSDYYSKELGESKLNPQIIIEKTEYEYHSVEFELGENLKKEYDKEKKSKNQW